MGYLDASKTACIPPLQPLRFSLARASRSRTGARRSPWKHKIGMNPARRSPCWVKAGMIVDDGFREINGGKSNRLRGLGRERDARPVGSKRGMMMGDGFREICGGTSNRLRRLGRERDDRTGFLKWAVNLNRFKGILWKG